MKLTLALVIGLGLIIVWGMTVRHRRRRKILDVVLIQSLIKPPRQVFTTHNESLQVAADRRRVAAEDERRRAALSRVTYSQPGNVRRFERKEA